MEVSALPFAMRREVIIMMMCPMWMMWIWGIVGLLFIVLLTVVIAKLLKK